MHDYKCYFVVMEKNREPNYAYTSFKNKEVSRYSTLDL
jgi:hypothetical protein